MKKITNEVFFKTARSTGSGGQNVNKVETMVEANWNVPESTVFDDQEKDLILEKLKNRINKEGILSIRCSQTRSQHENKIIALSKLEQLVEKSLLIPKKRKPTKPTKISKEKRLNNKKKEGLKKELRKDSFLDE